MKRKLPKSDENGLETDLFSFESVMTTLKDCPMISSSSFIEIISRYVRTQIDLLKRDIENKIPFKKLKLSANDSKHDSHSIADGELNFSQEMLQTFQDSIEKFLKELWKELILGKKNTSNVNNALKNLLTDKNREKFIDFVKNFHNASDSKDGDDKKAGKKNILDIDNGLDNDLNLELSFGMKTVQNNPHEERLKCICGILREEGKMIQCDKCQVNLVISCYLFLLLTFVILNRFGNISIVWNNIVIQQKRKNIFVKFVITEKFQR